MKIAVRRSLAYYIAASLATTLASPALAGNLTGPGSAHTVNPGDAPEAWTVSDRAELTLAAGSVSNEIRAVGGIVSANNAAISGANGTLLNALDGSTFSIAGGTIAASGPAARLGEVVDGSSIELAGVGMTSDGDGFVIASRTTETTLRISNSTLSTSGKALQVNPGGSLILEGTDVSVTGSAYAQGILTMGGTASISNSRIAGGTIGAEMSGGALTADRSTFDGELYGVFIGFSSSTGPEPTAAIYNSRITSRGAGALVDNGATLEIENTSIDAGEAGARVVDASFSASGSSTIVGELSGIDVARGTVNIDQSTVQGRTGDAILVYWPNGEATINISNASTLIAGSGVLVRTMAHTRATVNMASSSLSGDFVAEDGSTLDIALSEGANLRGSIIDGGAVSLSASGWTLAGNSNMASLNLGNGTVSLGDSSTFNTLNVSGNFTGADGTIVFNTVLADDDAATDKLIIGGDTSGTANVRVNNVGGAGAQTDKGIELIQVGGASNGQFNLAGRAVGGQYEYFLHKGTGADGNWYLRSQLPTQPDPCVIDPSLPECGPVDPVDPVDPIEPVPVLRPEPGAYLANLQAAQTMFRLGYHDRQAGQNAGRAWARVDGSRNGFDAVSRQLDIRGNSQALTVGTDLWRHDSGSSVGVMLSSGNASSTSTNELTGYYARGKVKGEALGVYGTWRGGNGADPYAGFYVDGSLQRAQFRNRVEGIGLDTERYDSRAWQGAVETGYAFRVGGASNGGIYLEPQLQVGYSRWDSNRHTEANGTVVSTENANGMFGRAGLRLSGVTRWGNGTAEVQPYLAANWLHTRAESQIRMDDAIADARIPRSRGEFSGGASVKFANGIGAWGGLSLQKASGYHQTSAQVGVSYSW